MTAASLMKTGTKGFLLAALTTLAVAGGALTMSATDAQAFSCRQNFMGTGCAGARGAVAFNRNGAVAVGRYGNVYGYRRGSSCYWRNAQRICL